MLNADNSEPETAREYCDRGIAQCDEDRYESAIADLNEAIRLDPKLVEAYIYRGIAWHSKAEFEQAVADFSEAIRLNSASDWAYLWRGAAHLEQGLIEEALADYNESIRLNPGKSNSFMHRGIALQRAGEFESAIADYTEAVRIDPENVQALCYRGKVLAETEENEKAIADFTEAIRLDPRNISAYEERAETWQNLGEHAKADADLDVIAQLESQDSPKMTQQRTLVYTLLQSHFDPVSLDSLTITERRFPGRVRADLQRALDTLFEQMKVHHFCGVHKKYVHGGVNFSELLVRDQKEPILSVPPQYEEIDIGDEQPLRCIKDGLWLLEQDKSRFAIFLEPGEFMHRAFGHIGSRFQVATVNNEAGTAITQRFFQHLERSVQEARSYRGKILSLEQEEHGYSGASTAIKVHKLRTVERDQVILPRPTLELLERNIIQFVQQRPRLAQLGLATKKGLLFYGPPGVGKTHTIHYLAGALEGVTTLLISAEQVGLLGEYMTLARLLQPSMVILEDADLIARERTTIESVCEEVLLNKLLNEMDGLQEESDILFILTTNRPDTLEAALASRPGRIDQAIEFPLPDDEGRNKLIRLYSRGLTLPEDVVQATVKKTANVSGAFIKELMRRAAQFELERDGSGKLIMADVDNALEELLFSGGSLNRKLLGGQIETLAE